MSSVSGWKDYETFAKVRKVQLFSLELQNMELKSRSVKLFCTIVETGSLLSASNKIGLSPSAASRMLSQLEDRLGIKLFERGNKQLTLSKEGNNFYRVAIEAMRAWKVLEDYPTRQKSKRKLLRTAVLARHCSDVILPAITKILKRHEKSLKVTLDIHDNRDMYYTKYSHPFDIGFGTLLTEHDDLEKRILAELPMQLVVSNKNPLALKKSVNISDYAEENFIMLSHDMSERKHTEAVHPPLSEKQIVGEISSTQVALRMVKRNVGVHITDSLAAISVSEDCTAIPINHPLTIPFYVFWPKSEKELSEEANECITEIADSILNVGIPLTEYGKAYASKRHPAP